MDNHRTHMERRYDLDITREIIVGCLVLFHAARIFDDLGGFYIKSGETHWIFSFINMIALQIGMPLVFVIAGYAAFHALNVRTSTAFAAERTKRLLIPFLFAILVVIPPQVFIQLSQNPNYLETYFEYYPKFFNLTPVWNFPWFFDAHSNTGYFHRGNAWFLYELFVFTLLCLPLFQHLLRRRNNLPYKGLQSLGTNICGLLLLGIPIGIIEAAFTTDYAGGWCKSSYIPFLVYGFLLAYYPDFRHKLKTHFKSLAFVAAATFILGALAYFQLRFSYKLDPLKDYSLGSLFFRLLKGVNGWLMVAMVWSAVERSAFKNRGKFSKLERYVHEAVLPFYLLHETILIWIASYVVSWPVHVFLQYFLICSSTYIATMALYELAVRRFKVMRFLFGMKEFG